MPDIPKRTKEYPKPATVEKEEVQEASWNQNWGGTTYYLYGVRPFTAAVYYGDADEKGNAWVVKVNDVRMKWNSPTQKHAENRAEMLLIKWMERAIAVLRRKHEKEAPNEY